LVADLRLSLIAPTEQTREISGALGELARRAGRDSACLSSQVYASLSNPNHLVLQERWKSEPDLARYVRSDDFTQVLTLFEMALEPPIVEFIVSGVAHGLDYVANVRRVTTSNGR
jgi:quinol monooxygenase YgiN